MQTASKNMARLIRIVISDVIGFSGNSIGSALAEKTERNIAARNPQTTDTSGLRFHLIPALAAAAGSISLS